jgi:ceramide glucosyltransferase
VILLLFAIPAIYQALVLFVCVRRLFQRDAPVADPRPISILKPVRGSDPGLYAAIASHASQNYPEFELLFAVGSLGDPAVPHIRRLQQEFPQRAISLIVRETQAANRKVGSLIDLERIARFDWIVVNDGDIGVPPDYLRTVTGPLANPAIGLVTCLFRTRAESLPAKFEALSVITDFAPSALVAPLTGITEFGLGSTLAFRRRDLRRIGGFQALADYLADDYQLGKHIHALGLKIHLSSVVVESHIPAKTLSEAWTHQVRWARTIRISRGGLIGYAGLPVTYATLWALVAAACGHWQIALALLFLRFAAAILASAGVLRDKTIWPMLPLLPIRDLWAVGIWMAGMVGDSVEWGGRTMKLLPSGKIAPGE